MYGRALTPGQPVALDELAEPAALMALQIGLCAASGTVPRLVAVALDQWGRARTQHFVSSDRPDGHTPGLKHRGAYGTSEWVLVELNRLEPWVHGVLFAWEATPDVKGPTRLSLSVYGSSGACLAGEHVESDGSPAVVVLHLHRTSGRWMCAPAAHPWPGGVSAIAAAFGMVPAPVSGPVAPIPPQGTSARHPDHTPAAAAHADQGERPGSTVIGEERGGGLFGEKKRLREENAEMARILAAAGSTDVLDIAAERDRRIAEVQDLKAKVQEARAEINGLQNTLHELRSQIAVAEGESELTEIGIYRFRHRLDDAIAYKQRIDMLRERIKHVAASGSAVSSANNWTVNGSATQGRKMIKEFSKLMLRAYNADADHAVRTMRPYKLDASLAKLDTTRSTIARLGQTMNIAITDQYHRLRREELELVADYLTKTEHEKERQRQLREEQREQQRAEAEYAREQERLDREKQKYLDALARLEIQGDQAKADEIRERLAGVDLALSGLAERRANLRVGHVYVISNIGAFGQRMVKIGMTRRLDPQDRVRELGDASVPFKFDTHAMIFSEDAVALETALHHRFAAQRVNMVNARREFFYVTPAEVRDALAELGSQYLIEYNEDADADEWRQSTANVPAELADNDFDMADAE